MEHSNEGNLPPCWAGVGSPFDSFAKAGVECIVPPPCSKRTLSLGVKHSPEWVCLPFKLNLGNFIEAMEQGADTLVYVAGPGLCRLGYYSKLAEQILRDAGYEFEMVTFDWQEKQIVGLAEFSGSCFRADRGRSSSPTSSSDCTDSWRCWMTSSGWRTGSGPRVTKPAEITAIWRTAGERVAKAWTDGI